MPHKKPSFSVVFQKENSMQYQKIELKLDDGEHHESRSGSIVHQRLMTCILYIIAVHIAANYFQSTSLF